ncbi:gamma-glutamyltranspeptidase [Paraburkholderia sp. GAS334]
MMHNPNETPARTTRPVSRAERGMVATAHPLATQEALAVLRAGGSAVDAALTAAAMLSVVQPHMTGIGGDAFWMIAPAGEAPIGIDGSGQSARRATLERFSGHTALPTRGALAALTVPGAVGSWMLARERFGKLPLERVLAPAIDYAREGVAVGRDLARWFADDAEVLRADAGCRATYFDEHGHVLKEGARLRQPALAGTFGHLVRHGLSAFYRDIGDSAAAYVDAQGGLLDAMDFASNRAQWVKPLRTQYRGYEVCQMPPPSQGVAGAMILNFLDGVQIDPRAPLGADYFHAKIQAIKWAFGYRDRHLTDPLIVKVPIDELLAASLAARERDAWLADATRQHAAVAQGSDTTFICVADSEGNAVGLVQSLYFDFGAALLDPATGVLLQNRGSFFSLDPRHPNALAPGKRTASTLMSAMLLKDGLPYLVYGTQGGEGQPQTQTSIATRVADFGWDVQRAIEAPRVLCGRAWGDASNRLLLEDSAPAATFDALRALGHPVEAAAALHPLFGTAQAIRLRGPWSPFFEGGADPRGEGVALGY